MRLRDRIDEYTWSLPETQQFIASPAAGVERIPLYRVGREQARATSLVRYAPGSRFAAHSHPYGEEFLVLEGEFADQHGRYPALTWVHNPHGSAHAPFSDPGCLLFVRLRQMAATDALQRVLPLDTTTPGHGCLETCLHRHGDVETSWLRAASGVRIARNASFHAQEALVVRGRVEWQTDQVRELGPRAWIRVPPGCPLRVTTVEPSLIYVRISPKDTGDPDIR